MAGGMDLGTGGRGGKKPLDTAINLVPFIDLMAVTISFLIMTAVWNQIGRLQVNNAGGEAEPTETQKQIVPVVLLMTPTELRLTAGGSAFDPIPLVRDDKNKVDLTKLQAKLKEVKTQLPDQSVITVQSEDTVRYEDLVRVIDEAYGAEFQNVSVSPVAGG
jgi:biopolymer transport protein TolR